MKVLIIGGGGREHTLAWKLDQEEGISEIFIAPGNGGTARLGENVPIAIDDIKGLTDLAEKKGVDLTIVGPEAPLTLGIVDSFRKRGLRVFGPDKKAARIEGSKSFAKRIMQKYNIPTAESGEFTDPGEAKKYIMDKGPPIVIKADGLAAGKGVFPSANLNGALKAVDRIMLKREFGDAGKKIIVEEFLTGEEVSFLAFTDGKTVLPMASSQDHKPIYDGDKGPNTGGMGAYSPAPVITDDLFKRITEEIMIPAVRGMVEEGCQYTGVLYAGLMIKDGEPRVLEFNARFGDPEAQPLLMRLKSDLSPILMATIEGRLSEINLEWDSRPAVCVVMSSGKYPDKYEIGFQISGVDGADRMDDVVVFHAGTALIGSHLNTAGGRVLGVTALGSDLSDAIGRAYKAVDRIDFDGFHFRKDIGKKGLRHVEG